VDQNNETDKGGGLWGRLKDRWNNKKDKQVPIQPPEIVEAPSQEQSRSLTETEIDNFYKRWTEIFWESGEVKPEDEQVWAKILENPEDKYGRDTANRILGHMGVAFEMERDAYSQVYYNQRKVAQRLLKPNISGVAKILREDLQTKEGVSCANEVAGVVRYVDYCGEVPASISGVWSEYREKIFEGLETENTVRDFSEDGFLLVRQLFKDGNGEDKIFAQQKIREVLEGKKYVFYNNLEFIKILTYGRGHNGWSRETRENIIEPYLREEIAKVGMNYDQLQNSLKLGNVGRETSLWQNAWADLMVMKEVEDEIKGGVKKLYDEWNVELFFRNPAEVWTDMLESLENKGQRWVVAVVAKEDEGRALVNTSEHGDYGIAKTQRLLKKQGYALRIMEVGSLLEIEKVTGLVEAGKYIQADGFIVDSHGGKDGTVSIKGEGEQKLTVGNIREGKWPLKRIVKPGSVGVGTMCFGGQGAIQAMGETMKANQVLGQPGDKGVGQISPEVDGKGDLVGWQVTSDQISKYKPGN
jgi:hypothetical protein